MADVGGRSRAGRERQTPTSISGDDLYKQPQQKHQEIHVLQIQSDEETLKEEERADGEGAVNAPPSKTVSFTSSSPTSECRHTQDLGKTPS